MKTLCNMEIDWNERLWRYFKVQRLIDAFETGAFYFPSASEFADRFEGAVAVQLNMPPPDPRYPEIDSADEAFRDLKRLTKIQCWHRASYESDAMWKLYAEQSKGIALVSSPARMRDAFEPFRIKPEYGVEAMVAAPVSYEDLTQVRLSPSMLNRFFVKHRAFEWEREFRLAISVRSAAEFGVQVPARGVFVRVDLPTLIEGIVLGPELSDADRKRVLEQANRHGLANKIQASSLLGVPRYF